MPVHVGFTLKNKVFKAKMTSKTKRASSEKETLF
jgi:hypothetical protein